MLSPYMRLACANFSFSFRKKEKDTKQVDKVVGKKFLTNMFESFSVFCFLCGLLQTQEEEEENIYYNKEILGDLF